MKKIALTRGQFALVDDTDFEWLNQWKWYYQPHRQTGYAKRTQRIDGKKTHISMHHLVIGKPPIGLVTDHMDCNGLNNQRHNLRFCTDAENKRNRDKTKQNSSGIKGAYWQKQINRWYSRIQVNGKSIYLGTFDTAQLAGEAYNRAAIIHHGEFSRFSDV